MTITKQFMNNLFPEELPPSNEEETDQQEDQPPEPLEPSEPSPQPSEPSSHTLPPADQEEPLDFDEEQTTEESKSEEEEEEGKDSEEGGAPTRAPASLRVVRKTGPLVFVNDFISVYDDVDIPTAKAKELEAKVGPPIRDILYSSKRIADQNKEYCFEIEDKIVLEDGTEEVEIIRLMVMKIRLKSNVKSLKRRKKRTIEEIISSSSSNEL